MADRKEEDKKRETPHQSRVLWKLPELVLALSQDSKQIEMELALQPWLEQNKLQTLSYEFK